ncbi:hypothetical protein FRC07_003091 [Ceratobasidium sp. 392]|nr:hypothetical protein FRC07_003091 [Ceratobasidium sp. 392]
MSNERGSGMAGELALKLLRRITDSTDVFPPLTNAARCALSIAEIVMDFSLNKAEWREFGIYVQSATASVIQSLTRLDASQEDTRLKLVNLHSTLNDIVKAIQSERALPLYKRFHRFTKHPEMIASMRARVDDTMDLFQAGYHCI